MKNKFLPVFALALAAAPGFVSARDSGYDYQTALNGNCGNFQQVSTYGKDNREEYCSQNIYLRALADSVGALFTERNHGITDNGDSYALGTTTLGDARRLAPGQRFAGQTAASFCSGFLVGPDLLVTAGHCVKDYPITAKNPANADHKDQACQQNMRKGEFCDKIKVVFGYRKDLGGTIPSSIQAQDVYRCKEVISHSYSGGPDYTVIRLDRPVKGKTPLAIDRKNSGLSAGAPLIVMGYPSGLPLKIAGDAKVLAADKDISVNGPYGSQKWTDKNYSFLANLDTFEGNSGSPVFNIRTLLVEGILVSGDDDYESDPNTPGRNRAANYPQDAGAADMGKGVGEVCTRISVPANKIPVTPIETDMLKMNKETGNELYKFLLGGLIKSAQEQQKEQAKPMFIPNYVVPADQKPKLEWI